MTNTLRHPVLIIDDEELIYRFSLEHHPHRRQAMSEQGSTELAGLQIRYLDALKLGSGRAADQVIDGALVDHVSVNDVYLGIFQPTGYEIGRLWQRNQFSVAQEHLATAIIERQMGDLHSLFRPQRERDKTLVIGCVDKELHRLGARMVADFFEQDGWTVHYLGATVPTSTFIAIAKDLHADLIGLASQLIYHLPAVADFVRELDRQGLGGLPVVAGGLPFVQQPEMYKTLGVRFSGIDARQAVQLASQIIT
jgi:MerR family transcriptional regulator, light-induced transcriptional regulator